MLFLPDHEPESDLFEELLESPLTHLETDLVEGSMESFPRLLALFPLQIDLGLWTGCWHCSRHVRLRLLEDRRGVDSGS